MDRANVVCDMIAENGDIVAKWSVPLQDKIHKIEFEHGTTTGKRIVRVDGNEVIKRDWMFKLVGKETFTIGKNVKCVINVESVSTFHYEYSLEVDKDTMDVWVNGTKIDTAGEFIDNGTETHFEVMRHPCKIQSLSSGKKKLGIVHTLFVDGRQQVSEQSSVDFRIGGD